MATNTTICCHCVRHARKSHDRRAHEYGDTGDLGRSGEEGGDRRRRAFVDVGRPHVERHRRNLEAEAGEQEHQPEHQPEALLVRRLGNAGEAHRAGKSVDQRRAVEQHAGRQGAEDEILEPGLGRAQGIAIDRRHHVEREAHQLEPEIERDQVGCRDQHHHAGGRKQDQDRIFELLLLLGREIIERHEDRRRRAGQRQQLEEAREVVDHEAAAEGDELARGQPHDDETGDDQQHDRRCVDALGRPLAAERADHQQQHGADRQHDLRQSRQQRGKFEGLGHRLELCGQCASKAAAFAAPSARL